MFDSATNLLTENVKILKSEVSKTAYQGVLIALGTIAISTCLISLYESGEVSLTGIVNAQKNSYALWALDSIPFIFGIWGQYSSSTMAYQAGAMIFDQTLELRNKAENMEKQANYAATHDPLTDLPNRPLFYERVERAIFSAANEDRLLSILLIEIENFKDVYDTLGRNNSDLILKQISSRLREVNQDIDNVAKIDGNIFGILLTDVTDLIEIDQFAHNIQSVLEQPFVVDQIQFSVHTNIGIVYFPEHGEDVDTLVQRAGVALHFTQNSNAGYALYEPSFDKYSQHRLSLMSELRHTLERNGLELFYQPKVSIQNGTLYGAEALVRWNHPIHGFISPEEFIPMVERTRMIKNLTHWVLKRAFKDCANWHKQGIDLKISVNLSAKDLHDTELPDTIADIAASAGIQPEWIVLEITEGAIMNDPERALEIINKLRVMGFQFSIDDFGTGYSSLSYLKKMPLTELKIDKSFVSDIANSENDLAIVIATINLAHNLGLLVTAEGVESKDIMDRLKAFGCDIIQGYYLSKPFTVNDFNRWMSVSEWKLILKGLNQNGISE